MDTHDTRISSRLSFLPTYGSLFPYALRKGWSVLGVVAAAAWAQPSAGAAGPLRSFVLDTQSGRIRPLMGRLGVPTRLDPFGSLSVFVLNSTGPGPLSVLREAAPQNPEYFLPALRGLRKIPIRPP